MARIVVDAMGSDNYPFPDVLGAVMAAREYGVEIILVGDESKIKPQLDKLMGLDNGKSLFFQIGDQKLFARFEEGHSDGSKISAVHYIRFKFSPEKIEIWKAGKEEIFLVIDHPNYQAKTKLSNITRQSLAQDFS